ncbi:EAL domain-containing protein [Colwellia sp. 4_MG-2023]|uniref:GGDEF domain-containing phosphodiesterase n=1 Tax=unclassified Colwellia TaxID=196834 RepID=UPI0026E38D8C|nr:MULTISPECIES: GGDEF domain-containing phosphodiesterase [unclassified Colwellia]MDO6506757.1 EAL domain-containing protein [Colwellia sp. 5_MG-2023]MDO6555583.1 EAL domain-containing protein [Colwellia sp. 4_MG-2023]
MMKYVELLMSLTDNALLNDALNVGDMTPLVEDGFYSLASLLSIDSAALWLLSEDNKSYKCEANLFDSNLSVIAPKLVNKIDDPEFFRFLMSTSEVLIDNENSHTSLDLNINKMALIFNVTSILLIPIHIKGINKGFIYLGDSKKAIQWSTETLFVCKILVQLFSRAVMAIDKKVVEKELLQQYQLMKEIESLAKVGGWDYEISTGKIHWTAETFRIHGLSVNHNLGLSECINFYNVEAQKLIEQSFNLAVSQLKPYVLELPFIDGKGRHKWVRTTGQIRNNSQGIATHIYGAFEDITEQKRLLNTQKSTSQNLKTIVDNLNDSIVTISSQGIIRSANRIVEKTFGYTPEELIGKNVSMLMPEPFASRHDKYMSNYLETGDAKIIGIGRELPAMKKDGSTFPMELSISEILNAEEKLFIGIVRDITERKKAEKEIHKLAYYDESTGVLNRYSFEQALEKKFAKTLSMNENLTVFLVNIDKFSQINLAYGEKIGDKVLNETAARLAESLANVGALYRSGADSFYIILSANEHVSSDNSSIHSNKMLADSLLESVRQPIIIKKHLINVQASIGILNTPTAEMNYIDIKPLLELAVSNAKNNGGNSYVFSNKNETLILKRYSELSLAMKSKSFVDELDLALQPQYSIAGDIVGTEALVRWRSPTLGFISPAEFIPLAEQNGAIIKLGDWVIEKVCMLIAQRQKFSAEVTPVSINLSAKQIAQPNFNHNLLVKLDKYQIPYSMVILELTESALIADFDLVISKMQSLKEKGINFSLDDFGTGYSSLSYINHLPISELKIDKSFVDNIINVIDEVPIINSIIHMAKALSLMVVAEGVETKEQLEYLSERGCNIIQGYYFSKPLTPEQWLKNWL